MEEPKLIKKNYKDIVRQKKVLIGMSIFVLIVLIAPSYALLSNFKKLDNAVNIKSANMNMSITQSSTISLVGKLPESDASGLENANPVSITVKNASTGPFTDTENTKFQNTSASTIKIVKYELKLVPDTSDSNKTTTLENQYIKYAVSTDNGTTYSTPKKISEANTIVFTGYNLNLGQTKDIKLKLWIDEDAGTNGINKNYYGSIQVEMYQNATVPAGEVVRANIKSNNTSSECQNATLTYTEDGITYISGSATCVDFNYLWYSGKMWRITAIYPDGAMKLVTDNNITTIAFGETSTGGVNFYTDANTKSYMYQWLNEDFYDTLYNASSFIDTTKTWNATMPDNTDISTKPGNTNLVTANVGLLNSYEYYNSYRCNGSSTCSGSTYSSGYLNIGHYWWLLNPYDASGVWEVGSYGNSNASPTSAYAARPSINLLSTVKILGTGTKTDPYRVVGDKKVGTTGNDLNTRQVGEYVKLKSGDNEQVFRIVSFENNTTKLIALDYVDGGNTTKKFATADSSGNGTIFGEGKTVDDTNNTTWYSYLKNVYISDLKTKYGSNMFTTGEYYLGINADNASDTTVNYNYRTSICASISDLTKNCTKSRSKSLEAGFLRYGEMFASQHGIGYNTKTSTYNTKTMKLMTRRTASSMWSVSSSGITLDGGPARAGAARPSINLSSGVKILSGTGLPNDPYVVGL